MIYLINKMLWLLKCIAEDPILLVFAASTEICFLISCLGTVKDILLLLLRGLKSKHLLSRKDNLLLVFLLWLTVLNLASCFLVLELLFRFNNDLIFYLIAFIISIVFKLIFPSPFRGVWDKLSGRTFKLTGMAGGRE